MALSFLWTGIISAHFNSLGKIPISIQWLNNSRSFGAKYTTPIFKSFEGILPLVFLPDVKSSIVK